MISHTGPAHEQHLRSCDSVELCGCAAAQGAVVHSVGIRLWIDLLQSVVRIVARDVRPGVLCEWTERLCIVLVATQLCQPRSIGIHLPEAVLAGIAAVVLDEQK